MPIPIEVMVTVGTAALAIIGAAAYSIITGNSASVDVDDDGNDELTFGGDESNHSTNPAYGEQIETEPSPYNPDDAGSESDDELSIEMATPTSVQEIGSEITEVRGVGSVRADDFRAAGYETAADLWYATDSELLDVTGIGPRALEQIRSDIGVHTPRDE